MGTQMRLVLIIMASLLTAACFGGGDNLDTSAQPTGGSADVNLETLSAGLIQPCDHISAEDVQAATGLDFTENSRILDAGAATCTFTTSDRGAAITVRVDVRVSTVEFESRIGLNEPDSTLQPLETQAQRSYWVPERRIGLARQDDLMMRIQLISPDFTDPDAVKAPAAMLLDALVEGIAKLDRPTIVVAPPGGTDADAFGDPAPTAPLDRTTLGWVENLQERVARGDWTLGEGIMASLRAFAGEAEVEDVYPTHPGDPLEGTGVVRLARQYLQDGDDAEARAEIERLLGDLFLSRERLDAMVVQERVSAISPRTDAIARRSQQPLEECDRFFKGYSTPGVSQCLLREVVIVGDTEFRVYFPAAFLPNAGWQSSHVDLVVEALEATISVYQGLGNVPSGVVVFSVTPAADLGWVAGATDECAITLYPLLQTQSGDHFKQVLAHELAHCFFAANYPAQTADYYASSWLEESGADYLSGLAYPSANFEWGKFDNYVSLEFRSGVLDRTYANAVWVQHIANTTGVGGPYAFLDFFAALPTGTDLSDQAGALSRRPGIGEVHHDFAEQVTTGTISDPGGGAWPPSRFFSAKVSADSEGEIHGGSLRPFELDRFLVDVPAGKTVTLALESSEAVTSSASAAGEGTAVNFNFDWQRFVGELILETTCEEGASFWILATSAVAADNPYTLEVTSIEGLEAECDEPAEAAEPEGFVTGIDPCLVGSWKMDPRSYTEAMLATDVTVQSSLDQSLEADVTLHLRVDGSAELTVDEWIEVYTYTLDRPDAVIESIGEAKGRWGANGLELNAWWPDLDFATSIEVGPLRNAVEDPPMFIEPVGPGPYLCGPDSFVYTELPADPVPGFAPVTWLRQ